jgi:Tfp pilus assembly protein PilX
MMEKSQSIKNENGSVLIIALIMLVLLTVLGITATSTSNIELQIAGNERIYKRAFYVANAGIEHARSSLAANLAVYRATQISQGVTTLDWSFALDGTAPNTGGNQATGITGPDDGVVWFDEVAFDADALNDYQYTVTVWNDDDSASGGTAIIDTNGRIFARAVAEGPNGVVASVQVILLADSSGTSTESYSQYGGDMTKNFTGNDLNAPTTYDRQMGAAYTSSI